MDSKYTTYKDIWARLTRTFPDKNIQEDDILEWCAECETEWIGDIETMTLYTKVPLTVSRYQALLPCNVFRILDVYTDPEKSNSEVPYYNNGAYLVFGSTMDANTVYMNFYGLTVDDATGSPKIKKGHEQACEAFCLWKISYSDWLARRIDNSQFGYIEEQKNLQIDAAKVDFKHFDRARMRNIRMIIGNMKPSLVKNNLYHQGLGE